MIPAIVTVLLQNYLFKKLQKEVVRRTRKTDNKAAKQRLCAKCIVFCSTQFDTARHSSTQLDTARHSSTQFDTTQVWCNILLVCFIFNLISSLEIFETSFKTLFSGSGFKNVDFALTSLNSDPRALQQPRDKHRKHLRKPRDKYNQSPPSRSFKKPVKFP